MLVPYEVHHIMNDMNNSRLQENSNFFFRIFENHCERQSSMVVRVCPMMIWINMEFIILHSIQNVVCVFFCWHSQCVFSCHQLVSRRQRMSIVCASLVCWIPMSEQYLCIISGLRKNKLHCIEMEMDMWWNEEKPRENRHPNMLC